MAKHMVKCFYCGQSFDANIIPYQMVGKRRYAHKVCYDKQSAQTLQENQDAIDLDNYISELFGKDANWSLIKKQIKTYIEQNNYSYSGIRKALKYFYEVQGNSIEKGKTSGIGIIPYIYKDAYNYYYAIWEANQVNKRKLVMIHEPTEKIIKIPIPEVKVKKRKIFSFLDEEE